MGMTELIVAALATWEILEIWRHSSLLASWRSITENWEGFWGDLTSCPFCMAPWTALVCLVLLAPYRLLPGEWSLLGLMPTLVIYAFAVARLANLGNDLGYPFCRTVRHNKILPTLPDAPEAAASSLNPDLEHERSTDPAGRSNAELAS
jgi:hypothetical protein